MKYMHIIMLIPQTILDHDGKVVILHTDKEVLPPPVFIVSQLSKEQVVWRCSLS